MQFVVSELLLLSPTRGRRLLKGEVYPTGTDQASKVGCCSGLGQENVRRMRQEPEGKSLSLWCTIVVLFKQKCLNVKISNSLSQSEEKREARKKRKMARAAAKAAEREEIRQAEKHAADEVRKRRREQALENSKKVISVIIISNMHLVSLV